MKFKSVNAESETSADLYLVTESSHMTDRESDPLNNYSLLDRKTDRDKTGLTFYRE